MSQHKFSVYYPSFEGKKSKQYNLMIHYVKRRLNQSLGKKKTISNLPIYKVNSRVFGGLPFEPHDYLIREMTDGMVSIDVSYNGCKSFYEALNSLKENESRIIAEINIFDYNFRGNYVITVEKHISNIGNNHNLFEQKNLEVHQAWKKMFNI